MKSGVGTKILFFIILVIATINFLFYSFNKVAVPLLTNYATIEIERIVNIVINNATTREVVKKLDTEKLINM